MATRNVRNPRQNYGRRPQAAPRRSRKLPEAGRFLPFLWWGGGLLVLILIWHTFTVDKIEVSGNATVPTASIVKEVQTSLGRHPFSDNLITVGLAPLDSDLLSDQHLKTVTVERKWPTTLVIKVTERQLLVLWKTGAQVYLVDAEGVAVQLASGTEHLPNITDTTGLPVTIGGKVAPARFVRFVTDVVGELPARTKLGVGEMTVPQSTSELYVKTSAGYTIKFDTTSGVEEQLVALTQVLGTLAKLKKTPTQYIDLRIPNKAYYL